MGCDKVSLEARLKQVFERSNGNIIVVHEFLRNEGYSYRKDHLEGLVAGISLHSKDNGKFTEKDFEKPRRITEEEKERIIELYEECDGYALRASEKLRNEGNYRIDSSIIKIWREKGLEIRKRGTPRGSKSGTKRIPERDELIAEGLTLREIAEKEGVSSSIIHQYIRRSGQHKEWKEAGEKKKYSKRDELIAEGLTLQEIGDLVGVTREAIRLYVKNSGQYEEWKEARKKKRFPNIDELISEGFSLEVIAEKVGMKTSEGIKNYLKKNNLYEQWKTAFAESSNLIGNTIMQVAFQKAKEKGFSYVKALEYQFIRKTSPDNIPFEELVNFFQKYEDFVKEYNKPPNITELGKEINKFPGEVKKILQRVNLPISKDPKGGYSLSFEQKQAIEFAFNLDYLSINDIGHFVGCSWSSVNYYFKKLGERKISDLASENQNLSYKKASQIFEAEDAGFTKEEIKEYASIRYESRLDKILKKREEVEPKILNALKVMFPEREITNPYL